MRLAVCLLAVSLLMIVLTLLIGPETKGARRWLPIAGLAIQPSEFVKPALVVVVAALLARAPGLSNALPVILLGALVVAAAAGAAGRRDGADGRRPARRAAVPGRPALAPGASA